MKILLSIKFPTERFNSIVRAGNLDGTMNQIMESIKPEAVYFTERDGLRGAIMIVNITEPSQIPALAEPFFLKFDAKVELHTVMSKEDLQKANVDQLGKKWG